MKKLLLILIVFGTLLCSCKEEKRIVEKINFERKEYQFSSEITEKLSKDTIYWKYQIAAFEYATKGDYRNALILWDTAIKTRIKEFTKKKTDSINDVYAKVKAIDYIVEEAKKSQVVIINEAHHNSFHRVFTRALLKKLFDNGYKNLGLEALSNGEYLDSMLNERKYPINSTGYYTKDPQFGNLVREALEIGYTLFAYESIESEGGSGREIEQAEMIKKQIADRPNEKFLIHCGFAHAFEGVYKAWEKTMAGRLAEYTGINPLTIDQVAYSEKSNPKYNLLY